MVFITAVCTYKCRSSTADTVFIFQKFNSLFTVMPLHKILIDAESAMFITAPPAKTVVYLVLCNKILFLYLHAFRKRIFCFRQAQICKLLPQSFRRIDSAVAHFLLA